MYNDPDTVERIILDHSDRRRAGRLSRNRMRKGRKSMFLNPLRELEPITFGLLEIDHLFQPIKTKGGFYGF